MRIGHEIVSYVIKGHALRPFLNAGLSSAWLHSNEDGSLAVFPTKEPEREAYAWILDHYGKHHKVPDLELFQRNFPARAYKLSTANYTASELIEIATEEVQRFIIANAASDMAQSYDDGLIDDACEILRLSALKLKVGINDPGRIIVMGDPDFDLEALLNRKVEMGVPLGIKSIDDQFYGWQPGQLITFLGRQKSTKTTSLLWSAYSAWLEGFTAIIYSVEMSPEQIMEKLLAIGAEANSENIRRGDTSDREKDRIRDFEVKLEGDFEDVRIMISEKGAMLTVDDIEADIERYHPHVIFIDGYYFMKDQHTGDCTGSDWRANENTAYDLKKLAMRWDMPIVTTTQVQEKQHNRRKRGVDAGTIMGGTGLLKASDLVLGFDKDPDEPRVTINGVLSRYAPIETIAVRWDWEVTRPELVELEDESEEF